MLFAFVNNQFVVCELFVFVMIDYKLSYDVLSELYLRKTQLNIVVPFIVSLFGLFYMLNLLFYLQKKLLSTKNDENSEEQLQTQQSILDCTAKNKRLEKYPLALKYQQQFLAQLIRVFEELYQKKSKDTFYYEIYELYTQLLQANSIADVSVFTSETIPPDHKLITRMAKILNTDSTVGFVTHNIGHVLVSTLETNQIVSEGTTGFRTWPAALHLADYLINGHNELVDVVTNTTFTTITKSWKNVIELGAGSGLLGIALLKSGVFQKQKDYFYDFTDHKDTILERITMNLLVNGVLDQSDQTQTQVSTLDWCDTTLKTTKTKYDLILATDVVFDPALIDDLVTTLLRLMKLNEDDNNLQFCQTDCLICCAERNTSLLDLFEKKLQHFGLKVEIISTRKHPLWVHKMNKSLKQFQSVSTEIEMDLSMETLDADSVSSRIYFITL